jgi:hypothetical protein
MITDCGLDLVEIGHSERREHFGETDKTVGLKIAAAVRHDLVPLVCVGETLVEREAGRTSEVLSNQVKGALQFLDVDALSAQIVFAYKPVWAIGERGIPASSDYAATRSDQGLATDFLPAVPAGQRGRQRVRRFTDPVTFRNNMLSTYNVFEASRRLGIKNIVWASSETALDCRSRRRTLRSARRRMCPPGKRLFSFEVVERRDG